MLIGPTITLAELEANLQEKLDENKKVDTDLFKRFREIQVNIQSVERSIKLEDGKTIANPAHVELIEESRKLQNEMDEILSQNDFIKQRLDELENIEDTSRGALNKDKATITLTLNDCVNLGIESVRKED